MGLTPGKRGEGVSGFVHVEFTSSFKFEFNGSVERTCVSLTVFTLVDETSLPPYQALRARDHRPLRPPPKRPFLESSGLLATENELALEVTLVVLFFRPVLFLAALGFLISFPTCFPCADSAAASCGDDISASESYSAGGGSGVLTRAAAELISGGGSGRVDEAPPAAAELSVASSISCCEYMSSMFGGVPVRTKKLQQRGITHNREKLKATSLREYGYKFKIIYRKTSIFKISV